MVVGKQANLTGLTFGYLYVVGEAISRDKHQRRLWICTCKCGNEVLLTTYLLSGRKQFSCGCYQREKTRKGYGEASLRRVYRQYKRHAEERNLNFSLSIDQFKNITSKNCHYCNVEPKQCLTKANRHYGQYIYNGIDRINNEAGYTEENCLPCCKHCNWSKKDLTAEEFKNWVISVYKHRFSTES